MWWDTLLAIIIVLGFLIIIVAKITHQTIVEMFKSIMDLIGQKKDGTNLGQAELLVEIANDLKTLSKKLG